MAANRAGFKQWNVRLPPDLSDAITRHLANPLLVGLPKGDVAALFETALRAELAKRGAPAPKVVTFF